MSQVASVSVIGISPISPISYPPQGFSVEWEQFKSRQRDYLACILERKWACSKTCITSQDGKHHTISDEQLSSWIVAVSNGIPHVTTSQPPESRLNMDYKFKPSMGGSSNLASVRPPSRSHNIEWTALAMTASIQRTIRPSYSSSGVMRTIRSPFVGTTLFIAGTTESLLVWSRVRHCRRFISRMRWSCNDTPEYIIEERLEDLCKILDKLLELSRDCYSDDIRRCALAIINKANEGLNQPEPYQPLVSTCASYINHTVPSTTLPEDALDDIYRGLKDRLDRPRDRSRMPAATTIFITALSSHLLYNPYHTGNTGALIALQTFVSNEYLNYRKLDGKDIETLEILVEFLMKPYHSECVLQFLEARLSLLNICVRCIPQKVEFKLVVRGPNGIPHVLGHLRSVLSNPNVGDNEAANLFPNVNFLKQCSKEKSLADLNEIWVDVIGLMLSVLSRLPLTSSQFQTDEGLNVILLALTIIHFVAVKNPAGPAYASNEELLSTDAYLTIKGIATRDRDPLLLKMKPKDRPLTPSELARRKQKRPPAKLVREEFQQKITETKRKWDGETVERRQVVKYIIDTAKEILSSIDRHQLALQTTSLLRNTGDSLVLDSGPLGGDLLWLNQSTKS
ncbi:hypothetical protein BU17DRAFT_91978 [Hysterangium stoloniferum]|nr:hypothetical protein BU17DRAFT_91978 [Hysterangium stoloniferum]